MASAVDCLSLWSFSHTATAGESNTREACDAPTKAKNKSTARDQGGRPSCFDYRNINSCILCFPCNFDVLDFPLCSRPRICSRHRDRSTGKDVSWIMVVVRSASTANCTIIDVFCRCRFGGDRISHHDATSHSSLVVAELCLDSGRTSFLRISVCCLGLSECLFSNGWRTT